MSDLLDIAVRAALAGSHAILEEMRSAITVQQKADQTPVTNADLASSEAIEAILATTSSPVLGEESTAFPWETRKKWKSCWIVDPLDGTRDFVNGGKEFAVNIAWAENGVPKVGVLALPMVGVVYFGEKNEVYKGRYEGTELLGKKLLPRLEEREKRTYVISKSRPSKLLEAYLVNQQKQHLNVKIAPVGSAHKFIHLLEGKATVYPRFSPCMEWDVAAGHALLRAHGKNLIDLSTNRPMVYNKEDLYVQHFLAE